MAITLPTKPVPAETQDPKRLIIYSRYKMGKSSACAALPNALCIDTEQGGYDYLTAMKYSVNSVKDLTELCKAIKEAGCPYQFIVIDSVSRLEDMCKPLALKLFLETPAGANFQGDDVLTASHGAGYGALRKAVEMCIDMVAKCTPNIILICHTKDAAIKNGDATVSQLSLSGKLGSILASKSDAIGWMTRNENSDTVLSFNTNDTSIEAGARPEHLKNKDVVLGEMQENGNIIYHWERIYPSLNKQ